MKIATVKTPSFRLLVRTTADKCSRPFDSLFHSHDPATGDAQLTTIIIAETDELAVFWINCHTVNIEREKVSTRIYFHDVSDTRISERLWPALDFIDYGANKRSNVI